MKWLTFLNITACHFKRKRKSTILSYFILVFSSCNALPGRQSQQQHSNTILMLLELLFTSPCACNPWLLFSDIFIYCFHFPLYHNYLDPQILQFSLWRILTVVQWFFSPLAFPFTVQHPKHPTSEFVSTWNSTANYLQKQESLSYIHLVKIVFLNSVKIIIIFSWF